MNLPLSSKPSLHERVGLAALGLLVGLFVGLVLALILFAVATRPEEVSISKCVFSFGAIAAAFGFAYPRAAMHSAEAVVHFSIGALGGIAAHRLFPEASAPTSLKYALLAGTACGFVLLFLLW